MDKLRSMALNQHLRRTMQGDSFESAEAVLGFIYEHLKSRGEPTLIEHILDNDANAIEIFNIYLEHKEERLTPPKDVEVEHNSSIVDHGWVDFYSLGGLVLQRRCIDQVGEEHHEMQTTFTIQNSDLQKTAETYIFQRNIWGEEYSSEVVEWFHDDEVILHSIMKLEAT